MPRSWQPSRLAVAALAACAVALAAAPAGAGAHAPVPQLDWKECDGGLQCATAEVPLDYSRPHGRTIDLALVRFRALDREHRIGSMFIHPGGSGGAGVSFVRTAPPQALALIGRRFDVIGVDTRGVGASRRPSTATPIPSARASTASRSHGRRRSTRPRSSRTRGPMPAAAPSATARCWPTSSSADMARDFDLLRAAVGDERITYVGNSYGTLVGATYASLFPGRARALLLTAPMDADAYVNRPFEALREQTASLEHGLLRFFAACAVHQDACGFGGSDPQEAFDDLAAALDVAPAPAPRAANPRPVDGDDVRFAGLYEMLSPRRWPRLAAALREAQAGDGSALRGLVDGAYERTPDGGSPTMDVNWATLGNDQRYPHQVAPFLEAGRHAAALFDHTYLNDGYSELVVGQFPVRADGAFHGPFRNGDANATALVVGTTHDTFVPFAWARRLVADLGNARLLTFRGDGHDVLTSFDPCVTGAMLAYLEEGALPASGKFCRRTPPFDAAPGA